jgi:hypothetical protein
MNSRLPPEVPREMRFVQEEDVEMERLV